MEKTKEKQEFSYSINYRVMHRGNSLPSGSYSVEVEGDEFMFVELYTPGLKPYDKDLYDVAKKVLVKGPNIITYGEAISKNELLREFTLAVKTAGVVAVIILSAPHLGITADMLDVYSFKDDEIAIILDIDYFEGEEQLDGLILFVALLENLKMNYVIFSRADDFRLQILTNSLDERGIDLSDREISVDALRIVLDD